MEIGSRLKKARTEMGLTQEKVAEEIGVSRQSISNWENNRSYPDIVSVIALSDLYSVSLDELLKEDREMINHLDEATNMVASRRKLEALIEVGGYLLIWAISMIAFWAFFGVAFWKGEYSDTAISYGYPILVFYVVLPVSAAVISAFVGARNSGGLKWLIAPVFVLSFLLADFMTFGVAWLSTLESVTFSKVIAVCEFPRIIIGAGASAIGMCVGILIKRSKLKKLKKQTE